MDGGIGAMAVMSRVRGIREVKCSLPCAVILKVALRF